MFYNVKDNYKNVDTKPYLLVFIMVERQKMLLHTFAIFGCEYKHLIVHFFNIVRPDRGPERSLYS